MNSCISNRLFFESVTVPLIVAARAELEHKTDSSAEDMSVNFVIITSNRGCYVVI